MISYKDYLNRILEACGALSEEEFEKEILPLFPAVKEIDWSEYYADDTDVIRYIFHYGVFPDLQSITIDDYSTKTREVWLDSYPLETIEDLDEAVSRLKDNGWTINEANYQSLKEELLPEIKQRMLDRIEELASIDQLESFIKSLEP